MSVHVRIDRAPREIERVGDSPGVRTAVADDDGAVDAEEQRAAVLGVVHLLVQAGEGLRAPRRPVLLQLPVHHAEHEAGEALHELEHDVPGEPVGHHHVARSLEEVPTLDVAHEVESGFPEPTVGLSQEVGPLGLLFADVEQPDARCVAAEQVAGVDRTHVPVLQEVLGLGSDVRPHVEDRDRTAGELDRHRDARATDTGQGLQADGRSADHRPGVAHAHVGTGRPLLDRSGRDRDRRARLAPERHRGLLLHTDHLVGVEEIEAGVPTALLETRLDRSSVTHEQHARGIEPCLDRSESTIQVAGGGVVAPHHVQCDAGLRVHRRFGKGGVGRSRA